MLGFSVPGAFFVTLLWLVWFVMGIATLGVFFRGMTALAKIPGRLDRIEEALTRQRAGLDDRAGQDPPAMM